MVTDVNERLSSAGKARFKIVALGDETPRLAEFIGQVYLTSGPLDADRLRMLGGLFKCEWESGHLSKYVPLRRIDARHGNPGHTQALLGWMTDSRVRMS